MDFVSHRLKLVLCVFLIILSALLLLSSCSAESTPHVAGVADPQTSGNEEQLASGAGGTIESSVEEALPCSPVGQEQPCFCPDGTPTGTQLCDTDGKLWPCEGCEDQQSGPTEMCAQLEDQNTCEAKSYVSKKLRTSILFVVDRSGSMSCNTPDDGQSSENCEAQSTKMFPEKPSKWDITIQALKESFTALEGSNASVGLMFFSNDTVCGVHSDLTQGGVPLDVIGSSQNALLFNALDNQSPAGGTPLVGATILAYAHLHQEAGGDCADPPCGAKGNRFVVLITDGADSCPDPLFDGVPCGPHGSGVLCTQYLLETEVPKAAGVNIRTFVIGAPGSEPARGLLSDLAFRGGTAKNSGSCNHSDPNGETGDCHFDMTNTQNFSEDLKFALGDISGAALGCEFAVPEVPDIQIEPDEVNVQYTLSGEVPICIPNDITAGCDDGAQGWQFAKNADGSDNLSKVVVCGDYCATIESNSDIRVDVILGCPILY